MCYASETSQTTSVASQARRPDLETASQPLHFNGAQAFPTGRAAGAIADLAYTLHMCARLECYSGNPRTGYTHALEAEHLVAGLYTPQIHGDCLSRLAATVSS